MDVQKLQNQNAQTVSLVGRFPWRTEPEISTERQAFLQECLKTVPNIYRGMYPFKDVQLTRADVEWLLIHHEQDTGPVDWSVYVQRERRGIDLRGALLQHADLRGLPLSCIQGGLTKNEWVATSQEQRTAAGIHLEQADLSDAHLEGALLRGAFLQGATLRATYLEQATFFQAHLEDAYLRKAHLEGANLMYSYLMGTYLRKAYLAGVDLRHAVCDNNTNIEKVVLWDEKWGSAQLADVHWGDCNLAVLNWQQAIPLGDEHFARMRREELKAHKTTKQKQYTLDTSKAAARAYRQIANAMRAEGMNDEADIFAYRAQKLQRVVFWYQMLWGTEDTLEQRPWGGYRQFGHELWHRVRSLLAYIFSGFLNLVAGFGYKPERSLIIYLLTISIFTGIYHTLGQLPFNQALVFSVTAFHGRGFIIGPFTLSSPITELAALEAVIGLFIEISFIATFTQRFFGR